MKIILELPTEIETELLKHVPQEHAESYLLDLIRSELIPTQHSGTKVLSLLECTNKPALIDVLTKALAEHKTVAATARSLDTSLRTMWRFVRKYKLREMEGT